MQYLKHIINLIIFVFIYNNFYNNKMFVEDVNIKWKHFETFNKLHNIVIYIQCSPQHYETFKEFSNNFKLQQDNKTQWNSWFKNIEKTLKLKQTLQIYCDEKCKF